MLEFVSLFAILKFICCAFDLQWRQDGIKWMWIIED